MKVKINEETVDKIVVKSLKESIKDNKDFLKSVELNSVYYLETQETISLLTKVLKYYSW